MYYILKKETFESRYREENGSLSPFDVGIPLVELSDETIQKIYYFRWHTYCKHLKMCPRGWIVTEFMPDVPWAGKYNSINCAAGHHLYEGRWIHDKRYLADYMRFWFTEDAAPRLYSTWLADAILAVCKVSGDFLIAESLLEDLKGNYTAWEESRMAENGLFYQNDDREGMEFSLSRRGYRPATNSYMYADAIAIAEIAERSGKSGDADLYRKKAEILREKINSLLWDAEAEFFKTRTHSDRERNFNVHLWDSNASLFRRAPQIEDGRLANARELVGYVPWYFNVPYSDKSAAWKYLNDERYFKAPYGPTTAEQNHPDFMYCADHECLWNGPSWPFATSQTLVALGNLLCNYEQDVMSEADYLNLLRTYANSHFITDENGERIPFIDENIDPYTGEWLARKILMSKEPPRDDRERGKDYNHSTYCDTVLSGIAGIRPQGDSTLTVHPLFSADQLDYMCADGILYHGHSITVLWDKTGEKYGRGSGFKLLCDGNVIAERKTPSEINIALPT
jgi:hypothetical protein